MEPEAALAGLYFTIGAMLFVVGYFCQLVVYDKRYSLRTFMILIAVESVLISLAAFFVRGL
jgi:hypothetical protein